MEIGENRILPKDIGEDALIERLIKHSISNPNVLVGPGDDCAVIENHGSAKVDLLKTDTIVEGVHFLPDVSPLRIGWKAMARPISDVAAMGGLPDCAVITVHLPHDWPVDQLEKIYDGMATCAQEFGVGMVGGEISSTTGPLAITVALTGHVEPEYCTLRKTGEVGDILLVTGRLGGSIEGKHLDFQPRLKEARWLVKEIGVGAMMDISDGLVKDLGRLAKASDCGYYLNDELIPCNRGVSLQAAKGDGEDYELLIAMAPNQAYEALTLWPKKFPLLDLTAIGSLCASINLPFEGGFGFDHFFSDDEFDDEPDKLDVGKVPEPKSGGHPPLPGF